MKEKELIQILGRLKLDNDPNISSYVNEIKSLLSEHPNKSEQGKEWIRPTDKQLIDICILFEDGRVDAEKLADMLAPIEFILDRLYENGDVTKPSSKEKPSNKYKLWKQKLVWRK